MDDFTLTPVATLAPLTPALRQRISRDLPDIDVEPGPIGDPLAWSLLFAHWPESVPGLTPEPEVAFYNRYFWFKRFVTLKAARDGYDAGLEQQLFSLLEQPGGDVDWSQVERLEARAGDPAHLP